MTMKRLVITPREAAEMLFASIDTINAKCHSGIRGIRYL